MKRLQIACLVGRQADCRLQIILLSTCYLLLATFLEGCATYQMQKSSKHNNGYVYTRSNILIPEYTIDEKNKAPDDKDLAKGRFKRRRKKVEYYYVKMDYITPNLLLYWQYLRIYAMLPLTPILLPMHAIQEYKYKHNPEYKAMIDKREREQEDKERQKIEALEKKLREYIINDMRLKELKD